MYLPRRQRIQLTDEGTKEVTEEIRMRQFEIEFNENYLSSCITPSEIPSSFTRETRLLRIRLKELRGFLESGTRLVFPEQLQRSREAEPVFDMSHVSFPSNYGE